MVSSEINSTLTGGCLVAFFGFCVGTVCISYAVLFMPNSM